MDIISFIIITVIIIIIIIPEIRISNLFYWSNRLTKQSNSVLLHLPIPYGVTCNFSYIFTNIFPNRVRIPVGYDNFKNFEKKNRKVRAGSFKGIFSDSNNIFLWHESEDINKKNSFPKFQLIPILHFQVIHDYVCFIAPINYCIA